MKKSLFIAAIILCIIAAVILGIIVGVNLGIISRPHALRAEVAEQYLWPSQMDVGVDYSGFSDITWHAGYIWTSCNRAGMNSRVVRLAKPRPSGANMKVDLVKNFGRQYETGLAYLSGRWFSTDNFTDTLARHKRSGGDNIGEIEQTWSWRSHFKLADSPDCMAADENSLYVYFYPNIYRINNVTSASPSIEKWASAAIPVAGICWDGQRIWVLNGTSKVLVRFNTEGAIDYLEPIEKASAEERLYGLSHNGTQFLIKSRNGVFMYTSAAYPSPLASMDSGIRLLEPGDNALLAATSTPLFRWQSDFEDFVIEFSSSQDFPEGKQTIVLPGPQGGLKSTSFTPTEGLWQDIQRLGAQVHWRVKALGAFATSKAYSFSSGATARLHFVEHSIYEVSQASRPAVGDLNGDKNADLVIPCYDNDVAVLLGNGTGAFGKPSTYNAGYREVTAVLKDFDGDGNLDAAITNNDAASWACMLGDGKGGLSLAYTGSAGAYPHAITSGYFNDDSVPDVATISWLGCRMTVFIGEGGGKFAMSQYGMNTNFNGVACGDFNGDGKTDIVASLFNARQLAMFCGNGDGTFAENKSVFVTTEGKPHGISAGCFDSDEIDDVAVYTAEPEQISIHLGQDSGKMALKQQLEGLAGNQMGPAIADFDRDGILDLASRRDAHTIVVLLGAGDGTFSEAFRHADADCHFSGIGVGDFNNDGWTDMAVGRGPDNRISIFLNSRIGRRSALDTSVKIAHSQVHLCQK